MFQALVEQKTIMPLTEMKNPGYVHRRGDDDIICVC